MHLKSLLEVTSNLETRVVFQVVFRPVVKVPTVIRSVRAYGIIDDAKKTASDVVDNVKDEWQSGKDKISTEASKLAGDVRDQAEKVVGGATDKAEEVAGDAKRAPKSKNDAEIIMGAVGKAGSEANKAGDNVKGAVDK
jgi:vacuolar-type H+-ATPase subunit H